MTSSLLLSAVDFMIQQPNLEVLNPTTLDDFLDKMEPMEGNFTGLRNNQGLAIIGSRRDLSVVPANMK